MTAVPPQASRIKFDWLGEAFKLFTAQPNIWLMTAGGFVAYTIIANVIPKVLDRFDHGWITGIMVWIVDTTLVMVGWLAMSLTSAGYATLAIRQLQGKALTLDDFMAGRAVLVPVFLYALGMFVAESVAHCFCFFPGFIVLGLFSAGIPLVAAGYRPSQAYSTILNAVKRDWLMASVLGLVLGLMLMIGYVVWVGMIIALPIFYLTISLMARDLVGLPNVPMVTPAQPASGTPGQWPPAPAAAPLTTVPQPTPPAPAPAPVAPPPVVAQPPVTAPPVAPTPQAGQTPGTPDAPAPPPAAAPPVAPTPDVAKTSEPPTTGEMSMPVAPTAPPDEPASSGEEEGPQSPTAAT